MTPEERSRVVELFDRLATLEGSKRDRDAQQAITEGLTKAPNATYALVQTVLVQDEALRAAQERVRELEQELGYENPPQREGGFLDNMRDAIFGRDEPPQQRRGGGLVPQIRGSDAPMGTPSGFRNQQAPQPQTYAQETQPQTQSSGGSFLGTAAAAAAGVVGGALLAQSLKGLFGAGNNTSGQGQSAYDAPSSRDTPWGGGTDSGNLGREAGLDDIGRSGDRAAGGDRYGALDNAQSDNSQEYDVADADLDDDGDFDFGDGGSDTA